MSELRRGAVVTYGKRGEFTAKPRPGVVIQHDATLAEATSITLCGLTTTPTPPNEARVPLRPSTANGFNEPSDVMVDKIVSISRKRVWEVVGQLSATEMAGVDRAVRQWLDL